jgi:glycopeptide antibiotics resistance protein
MVIDFTLISDNFGRNVSSNIFSSGKDTVSEYISQKVNLIPFATVKLFINAYKTSRLETHFIIQNILGNFFIFMPFAFLVPFVFKRINKALKFFCVVSSSVIIIEILQIVFLTGSADIDDFILNVSGAMLAYGLLNIAAVSRMLNKLLVGDSDEVKG